MNGELLFDSCLARTDLKTPEAVSRHAAGRVIPLLCIRQTKRRFECIRLARSRSVVSGHAHMDGSANLCRETCQETR